MNVMIRANNVMQGGVSPMLLAEALENYDIFKIVKVTCHLKPMTFWGMMVASEMEKPDFDSDHEQMLKFVLLVHASRPS